MEHFWDTAETIPAGLGFSHFGGVHLAWLGAAAVLALVCILGYRAMGQRGRGIFRKTVAGLLVADELFKQVPMLILGRFLPDYLPLHLCSINIFLIAWHAWRPGRLVGNSLYAVCIPGALAALLFPTWTDMPPANFMHIHSFTVHILLALYPLVLTAGGDIRPEPQVLPRALGLLVALAAVAFGCNLILDTNFMFLMYAEEGNPLYWFRQNWGSHLLGFPVIIAGIVVVLYGPMALFRRLKKGNRVG